MTSKQQRKSERAAASSARERELVNSVARGLYEDVVLPGIGRRMCQIARSPSFDVAVSWDIRETPRDFDPQTSSYVGERELRLYRSTGSAPGAITIIGYDEVPAATSEVLMECLRSLANHHINLSQDLTPFGTADGVRIELLVQTSFASSVRLRWTEGCSHEGWRELDVLVREMLDRFARLEVPG